LKFIEKNICAAKILAIDLSYIVEDTRRKNSLFANNRF